MLATDITGIAHRSLGNRLTLFLTFSPDFPISRPSASKATASDVLPLTVIHPSLSSETEISNTDCRLSGAYCLPVDATMLLILSVCAFDKGAAINTSSDNMISRVINIDVE
jgi:hypothetical protein